MTFQVSKELSAAASRRQSKGKSFEGALMARCDESDLPLAVRCDCLRAGVDSSSLLAPRKHENGHVSLP